MNNVMISGLMKTKNVYFWLLIFLSYSGFAQKASNIKYQFLSDNMLITYDLEGNPGTVWRIDLYLSENNGVSWSRPLKMVKGDVGDSVPPGPGKKIYWDRYAEGKEILKNFSFLVVASPDIFYSANSGEFPDTRTGRLYKWVRIGGKIWMAENLDFGLMIPGKTPQMDDNVVEKYCYNDQEINCQTFGGLYRWNEMTTNEAGKKSSVIQGICPENWHIPTDLEWEEMIFFLGGRKQAYGRIRSYSSKYWNTQSKGITNDTGLAVLPGGFATPDTIKPCFKSIKDEAYFWTSSERDQNNAYAIGLGSIFLEVYTLTGDKANAYSVRCVRD